MTKSTVPVGTNRWIKRELLKKTGDNKFEVASNPEFLREGKAIQDFFHPDRIKYASNAFLDTKITFINQMANLAEAVGSDIHLIARSMGMDGRISPKFLHPRPGYGGSCFPKDKQLI